LPPGVGGWQHGQVEYALAQVNIARLREPLDSQRLAGFVAALDMAEAHLALWWILRGHVPTTREAEDRVLHLREFGPTQRAFTLREHFAPPGADATPIPSRAMGLSRLTSAQLEACPA
jgi:hypothetical protein